MNDKNKNNISFLWKYFLLKLLIKEYPHDIIVVKIADKTIEENKTFSYIENNKICYDKVRILWGGKNESIE